MIQSNQRYIPDVETPQCSTSHDRQHKAHRLMPPRQRWLDASKSSQPTELTTKCAGVYHSHAEGDKAFEPINIEDLTSVLESGCVDNNVSAYSGRRNSQFRRLSIDSRASTAWQVMHSPSFAQRDETVTEEAPSIAGSTEEQPPGSTSPMPPVSPVHQTAGSADIEHRRRGSVEIEQTRRGSVEIEHKRRGSAEVEQRRRLPNDLTATTILKWRQHKQITNSPAADFAKDKTHFELLERLAEKIAISIPMPLMIEICNEACPIVAETLNAYEKALGKSNPMVKDAAARFKELHAQHRSYADI